MLSLHAMMELNNSMLKLWVMSFVLTDFWGFANGKRTLQEECYNGYKCETWFGYPVTLAKFRLSGECGCCDGYTMKHDRCVDINECEQYKNPCDQICNNTEGSYECQCKKGYIFNKYRNKCLYGGPCFRESHFCNHICIPLGRYKYRCECRPGFVLASDNISCKPKW